MVRKLEDRTVSQCGEQRMTIIKMHDRGALSILVSFFFACKSASRMQSRARLV